MTLTVDIPDDLESDKRTALAVALYDARLLSQGKAAGLAQLSRAAFLEALGAAHVSPFQYDADEVLADAERISQMERARREAA